MRFWRSGPRPGPGKRTSSHFSHVVPIQGAPASGRLPRRHVRPGRGKRENRAVAVSLVAAIGEADLFAFPAPRSSPPAGGGPVAGVVGDLDEF